MITDNTEIKESIKNGLRRMMNSKHYQIQIHKKKLIIKNRKIFINKFLLTREYF
jgi:hypothetical protein